MARAFIDTDVAPDLMEMVPVPFGEWLPDLPPKDNPGALEALNVMPTAKAYTPFSELVSVDGSLNMEARGAAAIYTNETDLNVYAGVIDGIFARGNNFARLYTSPINISDYNAWQFIPFGDNVVALHPQIAPVAANVGGATPFSPLGGSPPTAGCGARIKDFLVLGNLSYDPDSGVSNPWPYRVRWGGFNNIDAPWVTDPATQSDYQDLPTEGGPIAAITGREVGTVFQARSISRMIYEGLPTVFSFETVEENRGAISRDSVVDIGPFAFYIAEDGFHIWNGTNSTPIGDNRVNKYFFNRLNYAARSRIAGAVDYTNKCILWAFPTGSNFTLDEIIIYSIAENRWSHAIHSLEYLFSSGLPTFNLDTLGGNVDTDYSDSFDSLIYNGGGHSVLAGFSENHDYGFFTGANLEAVIDTGEFTGPDGRRVFVTGARPLIDIDSAGVTISIGQRDQLLGNPLNFSTPQSQELTGTCPVIADARYVRLRTTVPEGATWNYAQGLEVWRKATGLV